MKQERIRNPNSVDRAAIESKINEGIHVILQFDNPPYSPDLLKRINNLAGEFGKKLGIRFYGHHGRHFDASVLRALPDVAALSVDCVFDATNLAVLSELTHLRYLSLGIYHLDDPNILQSLQLQNLEELSLCQSLKTNFDLGPLQSCHNLVTLRVEKHTKNIDSLAKLPALKDLTLRSISKKQNLEFVSRVQSLRRLMLVLGGRANISEISHPLLEELEIIWVMGFDNLDSIAAFPSLQSLAIENQIRLERVRFTPANQRIQSLRIFNCKKLGLLEGLENLTELKSFRLGMTALNIDAVLEQHLPSSLKTFAFYTGKKKANEEIRKRLDVLGYRE